MYHNALLSDLLYGIVMLCGVLRADVSFCGVLGPGAACGGVACSGVAGSVATSGVVSCDGVTCGGVVAGTVTVPCGAPCVVACVDVFSVLIDPCGELRGCQDISLVVHLSKRMLYVVTSQCASAAVAGLTILYLFTKPCCCLLCFVFAIDDHDLAVRPMIVLNSPFPSFAEIYTYSM